MFSPKRSPEYLESQWKFFFAIKINVTFAANVSIIRVFSCNIITSEVRVKTSVKPETTHEVSGTQGR